MRWRVALAAVTAGALLPVGAAAQTARPAAAASMSAPAAGDAASLLRAGRLANSLGRYRAAETAFRQALEAEQATHASEEAIASTLLDLALNVGNQGRTDEAAALLRRAEPLVQRSANPLLRARLATYRALNGANDGDTAAALADARSAADQWRALATTHDAALTGGSATGVAENEYANALTLQAHLELDQDNILPAYGAASEALLILNRSPDAPRWWRADALVALGEVSVAQGRMSAAETYFQSALAIRRQLFGNAAPTIKVLAALGRAYQHEGLNGDALATFREAFRLARALPGAARVFTADTIAPFVDAALASAGRAPDAAAREALLAEAFDAFQFVQSPIVDHTIERAAARLSTDDPALQAAIGAVQDREREAEAARVRLAYQQSLPDDERSGNDEARLKQRIDGATAAVAEARRALDQRFPGYERLVATKPVTLQEVRATLRPGEAVVGFLIGRDASFVALASRERTLVAPIAVGHDALAQAVTALRRPLEAEGGAIGDFDLGAANRLYATLFGAIGDGLASARQLVVVPTGPLANLPFALLVASPAPAGDYRGADWLIRRHGIAYTPSLRSLVTLRTARRATNPTRPLLGFGDPLLRGDRQPATGQPSALVRLASSCLPGGAVAADTLAALAPLPGTARELEAVARTVGASDASLFLGARATKANLNAQPLADYRIVYFATHGLLPGEVRCQAEPGLVLTPGPSAAGAATDGFLSASDIAALRLNADLVVLSACNTAAGTGNDGGAALSGLAEAFFNAGARDIVASHWQVSSTATTDLMIGMIDRWQRDRGTTLGDALRQAQLAMIGEPRTAHPFFWAAFVAIGDGLGQSGGTIGKGRS